MLSDLTTDHAVPMVDPADHTRSAEIMIDYRQRLIRSIEDSLLPGADSLPFIGDPMAPSILRKIAAQLRSSEIVLWRGDLLRHAEAQATAFSGTRVTDQLPQKPALWCPYGVSGSFNYYPEQQLLEMAQLLITAPRKNLKTGVVDSKGLLRVTFLSRTDADGNVIFSEPPYLSFDMPLASGELPHDGEAQKLMACLSFKNSKLVSEDLVRLSRAQQRRIKRGSAEPTVRVVTLRKKDRKAGEQPHMSDREYQCQWLVCAHTRTLYAGTDRERIIWVSSYVKGPEGKPFRAPIEKVIAVIR